MGVSSSRIEEDKALQLCRERKKFVRQALDGRCSLAAAHVTYIQLLNTTGIALRKFVEPEAPTESSLYTSTSATPEPLTFTEKSLSQFSSSPPSQSQRVDANETLSPSPSPPHSSWFQANHMKFWGSSSKKVEEKLSLPVIGTVTSSITPQNTTPHSTERSDASPFKASSVPPGIPPWDYFYDPNDDRFSVQEGWAVNQGLENADDIRRLREEEGIPELEDEEEKLSSTTREESQESEDEFDEPATDTLVRSFENLNRSEHVAASASPNMPSAGSVASETVFLNVEKSNSPNLSPLIATSLEVALSTGIKTTHVKEEDGVANKVAPKDFFSSIKDIEFLFKKASESGKEVPRMLEANKFHFRPIFPGKEGGSMASIFFKACFSCGDDPSHVPEEPAQTATNRISWHRTASSRSSSSRNPLGSNSKDDIEDITSDIFNNFCMISGSHASTLDRLYAWERKLYDEVKASEMVRREYDSKCRFLRQLESKGQLEAKGETSHKIGKTRAVVKDLHSRIRVAIHRIDSISKRIEELRDKELQPQLEELIEGLSRMWDVMLECHKHQFNIISITYNNGNTKISIQSESHRQITIHLAKELLSLSSSFTKWVGAQKSYLQAINGWLFKCVSLPRKSSKRKRRIPEPPLRNFGPPIYVTCGVWLDMLDKLPTKEVADSIKGLAAETAHFLPRQEKSQWTSVTNPLTTSWKAASSSDSGINILRDEASEDWISGFDRFRSSLEGFLGQLNNFAESSVRMYKDLANEIQQAKSRAITS